MVLNGNKKRIMVFFIEFILRVIMFNSIIRAVKK